MHPSEAKHRHDKIKRANEALRNQREKPEKSEKSEKSEKQSIFDRIKQNKDSNRDSRDSRGNSRENSPESQAVDKKRRRIIIQNNKNDRTSSPTVAEAAPLPPHSILQGTDSSKTDKSGKRRKIVVKRGSADMDSTVSLGQYKVTHFSEN